MAGGSYGGGTGIESDPYLIEDTDDFMAWILHCNSSSNKDYGLLMADMIFDISNPASKSGWEVYNWYGHLDMNGYKWVHRRNNYGAFYEFRGSCKNGVIESHMTPTMSTSYISMLAYRTHFGSHMESLTIKNYFEDRYPAGWTTSSFNLMNTASYGTKHDVVYEQVGRFYYAGTVSIWCHHNAGYNHELSGLYIVFTEVDAGTIFDNREVSSYGATEENVKVVDGSNDPAPYSPDTYPVINGKPGWTFPSDMPPQYAGTSVTVQTYTISGKTLVDAAPVSRNVRIMNHQYSTYKELVSDPVDGSFNFTSNTLGELMYVMAYDAHGATVKENTAYLVGDTVLPPAPNGYYYECTVAGNSGSPLPASPWPSQGVTVGSAEFVPKPLYRTEIHGPVAPAPVTVG